MINDMQNWKDVKDLLQIWRQKEFEGATTLMEKLCDFGAATSETVHSINNIWSQKILDFFSVLHGVKSYWKKVKSVARKSWLVGKKRETF